ncbi:MAG TPA: hypothetical protein VHN15_11475 [Thermoanaerobaculia bacterium]|nr:hypothetical protein [Thermoanaerobaculia bacterium]
MLEARYQFDSETFFADFVREDRHWGNGVRATLVLLAMTLAGCEGPQKTGTPRVPPASSPRPAEIPAEDLLTLATTADMAAAHEAASDPAIEKAVREYLGSDAPRWQIVAARPIGDYVLLWIGFTEMADGGSGLVYSRRERRIG